MSTSVVALDQKCEKELWTTLQIAGAGHNRLSLIVAGVFGHTLQCFKFVSVPDQQYFNQHSQLKRYLRIRYPQLSLCSSHHLHSFL